MTRYSADAEIQVFNPDNAGATPDATIPNADIESFSFSRRLSEHIDTGESTLANDAAQYSGTVGSGDRLRFLARLEGESALTHRWTALARNPTYHELPGRRYGIELDLEDFVFGLMDMRRVYNAFEDRRICGVSDGILETILGDEAPEIDQSGISSSITTTATETYNGTKLLDAVSDLADRADAVLWSDGTTLHFDALDDISVKFALQDSDKGLASNTENDDNLVNRWRVAGGNGVAIDIEQPTQNGYVRVSDSSRITYQYNPRKPETVRFEIWTSTTGSGENLVVRIQDDEGGAPKDVSSRESDIARKTLDAEFLDDDGYTTFRMPDHTLPPNADPWVIIESDGSTGQDVGVDTGPTPSEPTIRAYFAYPLDTIAEDKQSQDQYRLREDSYGRETLSTRNHVEEIANSKLRHSTEPDSELSFPARSQRAHELIPGDIVSYARPEILADGEFVVIERSDEYDGAKLSTTVSAQAVETV